MIKKNILFGVQGAGSSHLNRARLMAAEFKKINNVNVEYLFSGRPHDDYFDMDVFNHPLYKSGISFTSSVDSVSGIRSVINSKPLAYLRDLSTLRTARYDLVISDFEPITAWAAHLRKTPSLAIGCQYALSDSTPQHEGDYQSKWIQKYIAPADSSIGFNWYPYQSNILPPMIDTSLVAINTGQVFTLVYLPYEDLHSTVELLQQFQREHFVVYSPAVSIETQIRNVSIYPFSPSGFKHHLQRCSRVICNAEFELISKALHMGKPVLSKALDGHYEQSANALTLKKLGLANVTPTLSIFSLDSFIDNSVQCEPIVYPNVAKALVDHCLQGSPDDVPELSRSLWSQVGISTPAGPSANKHATVVSSPPLTVASEGVN